MILSSILISMTAQVKIGGSGSPDPSAVLELDGGTNKGLLLPRMTETRMYQMTTTPNGMIVFNTTDGHIYCKSNGVWQKLVNGNGLSLPFADTITMASGFVLDISKSGNGGGAILGKGLSNAFGLGGYSLNGTAVIGNSEHGTGGYFSTIDGAAAIYANGKVGIGEATPHAPLTFSGTVGNKIAFGGTSIDHHGIGIDAGVLRMYGNDTTATIAFGFGSDLFKERLRISGNGNIGIGNASPSAPLSFDNAHGNKISMKGNGLNHYGMGVQDNLFQIYTPDVSADIAMGHGNSAQFEEAVRIKGNGSVGIGTNSPHPSALLDVKSSSKGLLIPQMTKAQRNVIPSPSNGLLIYQTTDTTGFYVNKGNESTPQWRRVGSEYEAPKESLLLSENFPDNNIQSAGYNIHKTMIIPATKTYGQFGSWTNMSIINAPKIHPDTRITTHHNNNLFVYGFEENSTTGQQFAKYNVTDNIWSSLALPGDTRKWPLLLATSSNVISWGERIWPNQKKIMSNAGALYNITFNSWVVMPSANAPSVRQYFNYKIINDQLVVYGGFDNNSSEELFDGAIYNPQTNTWTPIATAPYNWKKATIVFTPTGFLVFGGYLYNAPTQDWVYSGKIYKWELATNSWTTLNPANMPADFGRFNANTIYVDGKIHFYSGYTWYWWQGQPYQQEVNTGYIYDISTNTFGSQIGIVSPSGHLVENRWVWDSYFRTYAGLSAPIQNISPITYPPRISALIDSLPGGKLMYFGGKNPNNTSDWYDNFAVLDLNNNTWLYSGEAPEEIPPYHPDLLAVTVSGKFLVWGNGSEWKEGKVYNPQGFSFANPQSITIYLYKKE